MLRVTGGKVYDPANGVDGQIRDICICNDRIVADVQVGGTIDATGMVVFPGGVDVHTHVAGGALDFARAMIPEDHRRHAPFVRTATLRGGIGGATPTTFVTGYLYAGLGYTTVNEAAVPILSARHTHEELRDTPIVDKACCVLLAARPGEQQCDKIHGESCQHQQQRYQHRGRHGRSPRIFSTLGA